MGDAVRANKKLNEIEAAQALGALWRERAANGQRGLTELQAAMFLRNLTEIRNLPEVEPITGRIPRPRRARLGRLLARPLRGGT